MSNASPFAFPGNANHRSYDLGGIASSNPSWTSAGGRPAGESGTGTHKFLEKVIERLEDLIDAETAALRSRTKIDLKDFNNRKSLGLLELSRAMRQCDGAPLNEAIRLRLSGLRAKLETNQAVLKMHLEAVREISSIVADTIRNAESDGTYSLSLRTSLKRP